MVASGRETHLSRFGITSKHLVHRTQIRFEQIREISWRCWSAWAPLRPEAPETKDLEMPKCWPGAYYFDLFPSKLGKNTCKRPFTIRCLWFQKGVPKSHPNDFSAMATKSPGKPLRLEAGGNLWFRAVLVWTLQETHCCFFVPWFPQHIFTRKRWCEKKTCQAELLANNTHVLHKVQMAVWLPQVFVAASCWWRQGRRAIWKRWMSYVLWNQVFWTLMFCTYIGAHGTSLYLY